MEPSGLVADVPSALLTSLTVLAGLATVLIAGTPVMFTALRRSARFRLFLLKAPLRLALADDTLMKEFRAVYAVKVKPRALCRGLTGWVMGPAITGIEHPGMSESDVLAELLAPTDPPASGALKLTRLAAQPWPVLAPPLGRFLSIAAMKSNASLVARILYPDEVNTMSTILTKVALLVSDFDKCATVKPARRRATIDAQGSSESVEPSFAGFVTAMSGAVVLVDSVNSRSGLADRLLLWHARDYRASEPAMKAMPEAPARYDALHLPMRCPDWRVHQADTGAGAARLGDFDKRVIRLRGLSIAESTLGGYLAFVLETAETCYASTELGEAGIGCKRIPEGNLIDQKDPCFRRSGDRIEETRAEIGRVTLITSHATFISADRYLALGRRSLAVQHRSGLFSTSAGGVIDAGGPGPDGDVSTTGMIDPGLTIIRESREEVGVNLTAERCRPVCVVLANDVEAPGQPTHGQLVAAVIHIAQLTEDMQSLKALGTQADLVRGAYEQRGFVDDLHIPTAETEDERHAAASNLAEWVRAHGRDLDQTGLVSCLYASALTYGTTQTMKAFLEVFHDGPWWATSIPGARRILRDPRALLSQDDGRPFVAFGPPTWADVWSQL